MLQTDNLKLNKIELTDAPDITVINHNWDTIDTEITKKVDKVTGKGLSTNDYTTAEKNKLFDIETGANNYTHPTTSGNKHIPSGGSVGQILIWSSDGTAVWGDDKDTTYSNATTSDNGLMSKEDKTKLNGATNLNTANEIVMRDINGNFSAGTITADLQGNASTSSKLQTPIKIILSGQITGSALFSGGEDVNLVTTEGGDIIRTGTFSHAEGESTESTAWASHAEGGWTIASGDFSHAQNVYTIATGSHTHAGGCHTTAETYNVHVEGQYNTANSGSPTTFSATQNAFVIGNGTSSSALSNAFRVTFDGKTYGLSAFNSTGADYAEYFEWLDGNPNSEDRVGKFVTLDGDKIRLANEDDDFILGVVSANPAIIGNSYDDIWQGMYFRDKFGRLVFEDVEVDAEYKTLPDKTIITIDDNGNEIETLVKGETICISEAHIEKVIKLNSEYDSTKDYIERSERQEWDAIGMLGQLIVIDDGSCEINGYCKCSNGIATKSENGIGYRVMKRIDETTILILFK